MEKLEWGSEQEIYTRKCMMIFMHRYRYYVLTEPVIGDTEYDQLEKELAQYELDNPTLAHPNSPTKTVGAGNNDSYPSSLLRYFGVSNIKQNTTGRVRKEDKTETDTSLRTVVKKEKPKKVRYIQEDLF